MYNRTWFCGFKALFPFWKLTCFTFDFVLYSFWYGKLGNKCSVSLYQDIYCCSHSFRAHYFPSSSIWTVVLKSAQSNSAIFFSLVLTVCQGLLGLGDAAEKGWTSWQRWKWSTLHLLRCGVVLKKGFWEKVISQLRLDGCLRVLWLVRGRGRSMCQT